MLNANLDPFQDLINLEIRCTVLEAQYEQVKIAHNNLAQRYQLLEGEYRKLRTWQQQQQIQLAKITHQLGIEL
jgi:hypothetical protein